MIDSPLVTPDALAPPAGQPQYSPAFLKADADMEKLAGDKVPQSLRYQYWQAINGDKLAKIDPRSAALAYDTSIMTSPQKAFELVKQTGGDPTKMYQARNVYAQQLVAQDPAKYQPMMDRWTQHNTALGQSLGLVPAANQQRQGSPTPAAAAPAGSLKALIDNAAAAAGINPRKMYGIVAGESSHGSNYDTNVSSREASYGPFQLNIKGGLGNAFEKETGLKVTDPSTIPAQAEWVAKYLAKNPNMNVGGTWFGYKGDTDWNPKWGNAGYLGGESPATKPSDSGKPVGTATDKTTEPEKSTFEQAADAVSAGISGAGEAKKPEEAPAIPTTKPNIPLPTGPIAPDQRELYAKALDTISKRNAANPPTQSPTPPDQRPPIAKPEGQPAEQPTEKEVETPNDSEA